MVARQYGAPVINEREYKAGLFPFVLRLDMIDHALKFNICIKACYHVLGLSEK